MTNNISTNLYESHEVCCLVFWRIISHKCRQGHAGKKNVNLNLGETRIFHTEFFFYLSHKTIFLKRYSPPLHDPSHILNSWTCCQSCKSLVNECFELWTLTLYTLINDLMPTLQISLHEGFFQIKKLALYRILVQQKKGGNKKRKPVLGVVIGKSLLTECNRSDFFH